MNVLVADQQIILFALFNQASIVHLQPQVDHFLLFFSELFKDSVDHDKLDCRIVLRLLFKLIK